MGGRAELNIPLAISYNRPLVPGQATCAWCPSLEPLLKPLRLSSSAMMFAPGLPRQPGSLCSSPVSEPKSPPPSPTPPHPHQQPPPQRPPRQVQQRSPRRNQSSKRSRKNGQCSVPCRLERRSPASEPMLIESLPILIYKPPRAFADFCFASVVLHFFVFNFLG